MLNLATATITMLGIFLLGSLIILVVLMPIVPMNIFSNAATIKDNPSMIYISQGYIGQQSNTDSQVFSGEIYEQGLQIMQSENGNTKTNASTQILSENLYISIGNGTEGEFIAVDRASCDAGDLAISGGFSDASFNNLIQSISAHPNRSFFPPPSSFAFDTWVVAIAGDPNIPDNDIFVQAWAGCFDNPPLRP